MSSIVEAARVFALAEIEKYGGPPDILFDIANEKGKELAVLLGADEEIVMLGTILMDVKRGEAMAMGKLDEHIPLGVAAAKSFLSTYAIDDSKMQKILACIEEHHGAKQFSCKEAEICANADCYKFLSPKGILAFCAILGSRKLPLPQVLADLEAKADEKWSILSLPECKSELEPHYETLKSWIEQSR